MTAAAVAFGVWGIGAGVTTLGPRGSDGGAGDQLSAARHRVDAAPPSVLGADGDEESALAFALRPAPWRATQPPSFARNSCWGGSAAAPVAAIVWLLVADFELSDLGFAV